MRAFDFVVEWWRGRNATMTSDELQARIAADVTDRDVDKFLPQSLRKYEALPWPFAPGSAEDQLAAQIGEDASERMAEAVRNAPMLCIHPLDRRDSERVGGKFTGVEVCTMCGKRWWNEAFSDRKKAEAERDPDHCHNVSDTKGHM